jgi:diguanylate cyclase (GGDEF)-like protein
MGQERARGAGDHHDPFEIDQTGEERDRTAEDRDHRAEAHDLASEVRDERADARDARAEARERGAHGVDEGAAADRAGALRDRRGGAADRAQAADDREGASADRVESARERAASSIDQLTGVYHRKAGIIELEREIATAKRTKHRLTLAFVDVDHLKRTNDSLGHAAGDQVLRRVADSIRAHLRGYDLVARFGGDEFVCTLRDVTVAEAAHRFSLVNADLEATHQVAISVGLAELNGADGPKDLIARADEAMYRERHQRRSART